MSFRMGIGITTGNAVKSFDFAQDDITVIPTGIIVIPTERSEWRDLPIE